MMARVIRSMPFDEQALGSDRAFAKNVGPGLLVTLDAEQTQPLKALPVGLGTMLRVRRPDGTLTACTVAAVEVWGPQIGLYFAGTEQHEIPPSSVIELPD